MRNSPLCKHSLWARHETKYSFCFIVSCVGSLCSFLFVEATRQILGRKARDTQITNPSDCFLLVQTIIKEVLFRFFPLAPYEPGELADGPCTDACTHIVPAGRFGLVLGPGDFLLSLHPFPTHAHAPGICAGLAHSTPRSILI